MIPNHPPPSKEFCGLKCNFSEPLLSLKPPCLINVTRIRYKAACSHPSMSHCLAWSCSSIKFRICILLKDTECFFYPHTVCDISWRRMPHQSICHGPWYNQAHMQSINTLEFLKHKGRLGYHTMLIKSHGRWFEIFSNVWMKRYNSSNDKLSSSTAVVLHLLVSKT